MESREMRLTRLVEAHQGLLLRICYVKLADAELARDAVQETFLKACRALDDFRGEASERTWLIRIAVNTCRSMKRSGWLRHNDRRITPEDLPLAADVSRDEDVDLMCSVMALPEKLREVILLYYWQNMNVTEIARALDLGQPAVSGRLARARTKLRAMLEGRETK